MSEPGINGLVTAVFEAWRREQVDFLVLRNYDQLPEYTGNDIDILVRPGQRRRAERVLLSTAGQHGFRLHNRAKFATLALYLWNRETGAQAHFDLFTDLTWRGFRFLECRGFLKRKVDRGLFYIPHPGDEAATNLLAYAIYSGQVKEKYQPFIAQTFTMEGPHTYALMAQSYGQHNARFLVQSGRQEKWEAIAGRVPRLRNRLVFRHLNRKPLWTAWSLLANACRLLRRFLRPPGMVIALCGPDGCGKSTVGELLVQKLQGTFSPAKSVRYHWKPGTLISRKTSKSPATDPHARPARPLPLSLVFFAFHWLEFFMGSHLRLRGVTFRGGLALIDRFYYDFFVDQRRYRLKLPQWLVWFGYLFLKKPDLVFLLNAPSAVLRTRKQEVSEAETLRQQREYLRLVRQLPNGIVVDAAQPPEHVAEDIARTILEHMSAKWRR